jgi:hypothetical protein
VQEGGEPSLFLAPSEQSVEGGIESEGVAVSEAGIRDIAASHGASPPPAVWKRTRATCLAEDISPPITAPPQASGRGTAPLDMTAKDFSMMAGRLTGKVGT